MSRPDPGSGAAPDTPEQNNDCLFTRLLRCLIKYLLNELQNVPQKLSNIFNQKNNNKARQNILTFTEIQFDQDRAPTDGGTLCCSSESRRILSAH